MTEILTLFLLIISVYFLLKFKDNHKLKFLIVTGFTGGLLSLARFNAVPVMFSFLILITYMLFMKSPI